jgi:hypothetical protein
MYLFATRAGNRSQDIAPPIREDLRGVIVDLVAAAREDLVIASPFGTGIL